jgi:hypothetical protein
MDSLKPARNLQKFGGRAVSRFPAIRMQNDGTEEISREEYEALLIAAGKYVPDSYAWLLAFHTANNKGKKLCLQLLHKIMNESHMTLGACNCNNLSEVFCTRQEKGTRPSSQSVWWPRRLVSNLIIITLLMVQAFYRLIFLGG